MGFKTSRERFHTSYVANAWPSEDTNELTGRATIVTDWYNISQRTIILLYDLVEDIDQAVGRRTTAEYDDFSRIDSHCAAEVQLTE